MLWTRGVRGDEGKIYFRLHQLGQLDLCFFRGLLQTLDGHAVFAQIDSLFFFEFRYDPLNDALVDVITAQVRVAIGGFDFDNAFAHFENGDIKSSATQVIDRNRLVFFLVETVSERRCGRLIDDARYFKTRNLASLLGGLALAVVKICGNGDHRFGYFLSEEIFRRGL